MLVPGRRILGRVRDSFDEKEKCERKGRGE